MVNNRTVLSSIALVIAMSNAGWGEDERKVSTGDPKTDAVMVALQKRSREVKTCTAQMVTVFEMMGQRFETTSKAAFQFPGRIRLELDEQVTVSDGSYLWIYSAEDGMVNRINLSRVYQATSREADADQMDPIRPFRGLDWKTIRYVGSDTLGADRVRVFEAVPQLSVLQTQLPISLEKVRIHIHPADGLLRMVRFLDESGKVVISYRFNDVSVNPELDKRQFEFVAPAGAHMMDLTDQTIQLLKGATEQGN